MTRGGRLARLTAGIIMAAAGLAFGAGDAGAQGASAAPRPAQAARPAQSAQPAQPARPNIIVILADDLGYGDLSSYGHPSIRTPRIDQLAREGLRLTSYYAGAPSCTPSRAALMTGRYPIRVGLPQVLGPEATKGLPASEPTLASGLKQQGYRTKMIGKWHLGHARPELLPTAHGFDSWFGLPYSNDMKPPFVQTKVPLKLYRDAGPVDEPVDQDTLTVRYTEEAVKFIRESAAPAGAPAAAAGGAAAPFFLYLAHNMPHLPLHVSDRFRGRSPAGLYGDVIEMLDWSTGAILDALKARGIAENTIVVFTSDNGPWQDLPPRMLQDGNLPWHAGSAGLLRGSKAATWEGGIRVPAIVTWPARIGAGLVSSRVATSMDLSVTLLEAAGAPIPADRDGRSLASRFVAPPPASASGGAAGGAAAGAEVEDAASRAPFFYFRDAYLEGVRDGAWKLRQSGDGPAQLFQLDLDPSERYDRAKEHPEIVDRLRVMLQAFSNKLAAEGHAPANHPSAAR